MPLELNHLLIVFTTYVIGAASPGPSNMRIMGVAMHNGRRDALTLAAGVISGSCFWGVLAASGLSAVLTHCVQALVVLKVLGGAYLLLLAFKAGRSAATSDERLMHTPTCGSGCGGWTLYRQGLLMHLTNPKAVLGWAATMTLGLGAESSLATVVVILVGCVALGIMIFCGYALLFSTSAMIQTYRKARRWIEGALACVFAAAGLKLLLTKP